MLGDLVVFQPAEDAQLRDLGPPLVDVLEPAQSAVDVEDSDLATPVCDQSLIQRDPILAAAARGRPGCGA